MGGWISIKMGMGTSDPLDRQGGDSWTSSAHHRNGVTTNVQTTDTAKGWIGDGKEQKECCRKEGGAVSQGIIAYRLSIHSILH